MIKSRDSEFFKNICKKHVKGRSIIVDSSNSSRFTSSSKGQLISKAIYGVLDSPKKRTKKI